MSKVLSNTTVELHVDIVKGSFNHSTVIKVAAYLR